MKTQNSDHYREHLVTALKVGISSLNDLEVNDILLALFHKYRELFADWEMILLSVERDKDPEVTFSRLVDLLRKQIIPLNEGD